MFGPSLTEVSVRYFHDNWGISSETAELSERISLGRAWYIEPNARLYHQTAANFYYPYLVNGTALPAYASSDSRLSRFDAVTYGLTLGVHISGRTELYLRGDYYTQMGQHHPVDAIGQLRNQNLFQGANASHHRGRACNGNSTDATDPVGRRFPLPVPGDGDALRGPRRNARPRACRKSRPGRHGRGAAHRREVQPLSRRQRSRPHQRCRRPVGRGRQGDGASAGLCRPMF